MDEQKKLLLQILEITDTVEDKEAFADSFINMIFEDTVYNLIQSLPEQRRESVAKKWDANLDNKAALTSLLEHNFTKEQIAEKGEKAAETAMDSYMNSIEKDLDDEKRRKLQQLSDSLNVAN